MHALTIFYRFTEAIAIAPPEHIISAEEAQALERELLEAAHAPLPDDPLDDDEL